MLKLENSCEKCMECGISWSPSLIESGTCIFCILKDRNKLISKYSKLMSKLVSRLEVEAWDKIKTHTYRCECPTCKALQSYKQLTEKIK